ncbi:uncharacterized protein LOC142496718 isoform X1 [Ascaphus truei]|uniref:uncharacterized protein LOC142496718 isoform X1 n=2 Tax=Ascaphus truei TaxID=8439 RepID=UPI003F5AAEB7
MKSGHTVKPGEASGTHCGGDRPRYLSPAASSECSSQDNTAGITMNHYCLAHTSHHLSRWLPLHTRFRLLVTLSLCGAALVVPQVYVLLRPSSSRFCSQPLLNNLVCNIGFTFFTIGFALLLTLMHPLPRWLRLSFHAFGLASFTEGVCTVLLTALAKQCAINTPALYSLSVVLSVASVLSTGFFLMVGPFWLSNAVFPGLVLHTPSRTGICYEPVTCCPCLWYV